jgi:hypothetical protein
VDANEVKRAVLKMLTTAPELLQVKVKVTAIGGPGDFATSCEYRRSDGSRAVGGLKRWPGWRN